MLSKVFELWRNIQYFFPKKYFFIKKYFINPLNLPDRVHTPRQIGNVSEGIGSVRPNQRVNYFLFYVIKIIEMCMKKIIEKLTVFRFF